MIISSEFVPGGFLCGQSTLYCVSFIHHMNATRRRGFDSDGSIAPCLSDDELQRSTDGSPGLLADSDPTAAQQNLACESAVHSESWDQPGLSSADPPLLPRLCFQGKKKKRAASVRAWLLCIMLDQGAAYKIRCGNWWLCLFSQDGEVVFEAERECGRPCPLRLSETGETRGETSSHVMSWFFLFFSIHSCLFLIRPVRVAAFPPARLLPLFLGCRQQTGRRALLSMAEPQRQTPLQVSLRCIDMKHCFPFHTSLVVGQNTTFIIKRVNPSVLSGGPDSLWRRPLLWTLVLHLSMRARWAAPKDREWWFDWDDLLK